MQSKEMWRGQGGSREGEGGAKLGKAQRTEWDTAMLGETERERSIGAGCGGTSRNPAAIRGKPSKVTWNRQG